MNLKSAMVGAALKQALRYARRNPEKNIPKILDTAKSLFPDRYRPSIEAVRHQVENGVYHDLLIRVLKNIDPVFLERLTYNFFINQIALGVQKQIEVEKEIGVPGPFTILISPTMRCNLSCIGCYAGKYTREDDMPPQLFDSIIDQGKELGTYLYTILGGEPFVYEHLFEVTKKHSDAVFQVFTNATLLSDDKIVKELKESGNIIPVISIEGWQTETDQRRGPGSYQRIIQAMDTLRTNGVPFGVSITYTRQNAYTVTSDAFFDFLIDKGALFGWYFLFMPVGKDPAVELMPTAEQRKHLFETVHRVRKEKPIFMMDFWGDAPYVGGCIAGGRRYIHINNKGDVEPCIFVHFAVDNIKDKPLKEALNSYFFQLIRANQPFNDNLLLPCQIIDQPSKLREIVSIAKPRPTHDGADVVLTDSHIASFLDKYSVEVRSTFDPIWKELFLTNDVIAAYVQKLCREREEHKRKLQEDTNEAKAL